MVKEATVLVTARSIQPDIVKALPYDNGGIDMENGDVQIRTLVYIDSMQPQYAAITGAMVNGSVPVEGMSELYLEVSPGVEIFRAMNIALKSSGVKPGYQRVERQFGMMEAHSYSQSDIREAASAILEAYGLSEEKIQRPEVISKQVVSKIDPYQAQIINRTSKGALLLPGESLFILEVKPAGYIVYSANEAEKDANIKIVDYRSAGIYGRLYVAGQESEVKAAMDATIAAIERIG